MYMSRSSALNFDTREMGCTSISPIGKHGAVVSSCVQHPEIIDHEIRWIRPVLLGESICFHISRICADLVRALQN